MQGTAQFLGAIALVVAASEAHVRISANVGRALLVLCSVWLVLKPTPRESAAKRLKLWSAMVGIACFFFGLKRAFAVALAVNVLMLAVPPLYHRNFPLAFVSLWLAALTPTGNLDSQATYMWCHFAVLFTYYSLSTVTREHAVGLLVSIVPMLFGLLLHSGTGRAGSAAAVYRCIGMLVAFVLPDIWHICTPLAATPFSTEVDGSRCIKGSLADNVDNARQHWAFRYGCYAVCVALLMRASVDTEARWQHTPQ